MKQKQKHKPKKAPGSGYAAFYRFLCIAAIYFVVSVCTSGLYRGLGMVLPGLVINAVLLGAGYGIMSLWAAVTRFRRHRDSGGYESDGGYFSARHSVLPIALIVVIGFVVRAAAAHFEYEYAMNTPGVAYDPDSILPFVVMIFAVAMMAGGVVLWFVPYERLVSQRTAVISLTAMFIAFVFWEYTGSAVSSACLVGYCVAMALALNQNSLTRTYRGTVKAFISPRARSYNMRLALIFCAAVLLLSLGGWVVAVGLATIGKAILYIIVNSKTSSGNVGDLDVPDPVDRGAAFNFYVFGAKRADDSVNYRIFIVFSVISVVALIIFLLRRQTEIKRLIGAVRRLLLRLIDFIFAPISGSMVYFMSNMRREEEDASFIDEEERLRSDPAIGMGRRAERQRMNWRDFMSGLNAQDGDAARLCYAYSVFASQVRAIPQFAKMSDTARELRGRIFRRRMYSDCEMADITAAFERAKYSGDVDSAEAREATEKLCRIIRRNMD